VERATGGKTIEKRLPARDSGAVQARPPRFFTKNAPKPARLSYPELIVAVPLIASMHYNDLQVSNPPHQYKLLDRFDLKWEPNITKEQCKNFRVDIIFSHPEEFQHPQFTFDATVTLSFSDPSTNPPLTAERKAISGSIAPHPS
jgi:hypothetical protein